MKKIALYIGFFASVLVVSCTKDNTQKIGVFTTTDGSALLRIIHASPSFRQVYNGADSFNIFINSTKINGAFPGITYAGVIPNGSSNNGYQSVSGGSQTIKLSVAGVLTPDSIAIATYTTGYVANSMTTLFITDSARLAVPDAVTKPAAGSVNIRFVDVVMNDTTGKTIDLYSTRTASVLYAGVKGGDVTAFKVIPFNTVLDTLIVRRAGTTFALAVLNGITLNDARSYTVYYRGSGQLATGTKARALASYLHQ